jgi:hypothetical protein
MVTKKLEKKLVSVAVLNVTDENSRIRSDPLVRGTDPLIWIRTKISRIRSNASSFNLFNNPKKNMNNYRYTFTL